MQQNPMSSPTAFAQQLIRSNMQNLPKAPWVEPAVEAIMSGDSQTGGQIAMNICNSMGVTKEQALEMAKQQIARALPFPGR